MVAIIVIANNIGVQFTMLGYLEVVTCGYIELIINILDGASISIVASICQWGSSDCHIIE
jgi:hypothetical protein